MVKNYSYVEFFMDFPGFIFLYALMFVLLGLVLGYFLRKEVYKFHSIKWAGEQIGYQQRDIAYVDDWDPERHELREFRVLKSVDAAESGEEYFREVEGGLARFVKLDRRRREHHGFSEIDPINAPDLSDGESAEEEAVEVDEDGSGDVPPIAAVSAAMAHADVHGNGKGAGGGSAGSNPPSGHAEGAHSNSATREYLNSLPGSRAMRIQEVGLFPTQFSRSLGQPDMLWDYPAFWIQNERHGLTVFCDIVTRGMYLNKWGSYVEQWFIHQDLQENQPGPMQ
eukprot:s194_g2.t1